MLNDFKIIEDDYNLTKTVESGALPNITWVNLINFFYVDEDVTMQQQFKVFDNWNMVEVN